MIPLHEILHSAVILSAWPLNTSAVSSMLSAGHGLTAAGARCRQRTRCRVDTITAAMHRWTIFWNCPYIPWVGTQLVRRHLEHDDPARWV